MRERALRQGSGILGRRLWQDAQGLQVREGEVVRGYDLGCEGESAEDDGFGLQECGFLGLIGAFAEIIGLGIWGFAGGWVVVFLAQRGGRGGEVGVHN